VSLPGKTLLLIFNPKAGVQTLRARLFDVVDAFTAAGYLVTVYPTQAAGEVGTTVAALGAAYDLLVCAGGDGTVSEAINAIMDMAEKPAAFGFIPSGTVNDFAVSLGVPTDVVTAAEVILNGAPRLVDVGRFDEKHFIYVAAFGLFTDVSYSTSQSAKNWLGKVAYFLEGAKRVGQLIAYSCEFDIDGEYIAGEFIFGAIANTHSIAGIKMPTGMNAQMDDGLFDVILIKKPENLKDGQEIIASLLAHEEKSPYVTFRKAKKIDFHAFQEVPWTLDGDFGGEFYRAEIVNLQQAAAVITPPPAC